MEKLPDLKNNSDEIDIERAGSKKNADLIHEAINDNFHGVRTMFYKINPAVRKLSDIWKNNQSSLGEIDKKKIISELKRLKQRKKEVLDDLIDGLGISKDSEVPGNDDLLLAYFSKEKKLEEKYYGKSLSEDHESADKNGGSDKDSGQEDLDDPDFDIARMIKDRMKELRKRQKNGILEDDREKLAKLREKISSSETPADVQNHPFDPQKDFLRIRTKDDLDVYKKKLGEHLAEIGKINNYLEKEISNPVGIAWKKCRKYIKDQADSGRITPWQTLRYQETLNSFRLQSEKIRKEYEKSHTKSPKQILEHLFSYKARGRIEIRKYPLAPVFYCFDANDYANLSNEKNIREASFGCYVISDSIDKTFVILLNIESILEGNKAVDDIINHEYQHLINSHVNIALEKSQITSTDSKDSLDNIIKESYADALSNAKNELLAFLKGGVARITDIYIQLISENYVFFPQADSYEKFDVFAFSKEAIQAKLLKFYEKYLKVISNAVITSEKLRILGFNGSEIINLLQAEPVENWPKILNRLGGIKESIAQHKDSISKEIGSYKKQIRTARYSLLRKKILAKILLSKKIREEARSGIYLDEMNLELKKRLYYKLRKIIRK